ncbi:hypothetical protein DAEQUDRAFT_760246 [Daedalea quercina L-15889]|uniref:Uncharacterized protein n=1 Tax=Daedalea quercina L-15889 TaxID=1314783 RepID=A0A165L439_9APHY|nr:hypothetical protein DAEQUDRAFT_760246 [Daedalea quercina L-15889]
MANNEIEDDSFLQNCCIVAATITGCKVRHNYLTNNAGVLIAMSLHRGFMALLMPVARNIRAFQVFNLRDDHHPCTYACTIAEQVSALVAEVLFAAMIWRHASMVKAAGSAQTDTSLTVILLRDGTLYFVTILALLIADTALLIPKVYIGGFLSDLFYPFQVVVLSRFFLKLREANKFPGNGGSSGGPTQMSSLRFERVVGSLAGSIPYNTDGSLAEDIVDEDDDVNDGIEDEHVSEVQAQGIAVGGDIAECADDLVTVHAERSAEADIAGAFRGIDV